LTRSTAKLGFRSLREIFETRRLRFQSRVSKPGHQHWLIKGEAAIFLVACAAEQSARKPAHSIDQSLLDSPPITLVCMKQVTSARLIAAKVVPDSLELLCAASRQARQ
jgi:hypothetical protein